MGEEGEVAWRCRQAREEYADCLAFFLPSVLLGRAGLEFFLEFFFLLFLFFWGEFRWKVGDAVVSILTEEIFVICWTVGPTPSRAH